MTASPGRFRFEVANPADDAALRRRAESDVMPGKIGITFRREPSFFAGCHLQGWHTDVLKCIDQTSQEVIGIMAHTLTRRYVDGQPCSVGYLSDLRINADYRGGPLLLRGFHQMRKIVRHHGLKRYVGVIYQGNEVARQVLSSGRMGLPRLIQLDRLLTPAIHLDIPRPALNIHGVVFRRADDADRPGIISLLQSELAKKSYAPVVDEQEMSHGLFRDLRSTDFLIAEQDDEVIACVAIWDQSAFRQTHVESYAGLMDWLRPIYTWRPGCHH